MRWIAASMPVARRHCGRGIGVVTRRGASRSTDTSQDEALIARIEAGDSVAFETLYDRYSGAVYGLALRMLGATPAAEEAVQEAFLRVWRRSITFRAGQGEVVSWLLGITYNLCIDELRRRRNHGVPIDSNDGQAILDNLPTSEIPVDEEVWLRERRQIIQDALSQLPVEQRHAIELAYFAGLSQRAIAEQTLQPLGTIKTRVRLGLHKLKEILTGREITID